jgi:hypothetical protein
VIDIEPESVVADGDVFAAERKDGAAGAAETPATSPELQPGEGAKATAIARPSDTGESVARRFRVRYTGMQKGMEAVRTKELVVKLQVAPCDVAIEDARSRARVGSEAPGIYSSTLQLWGFQRPDGIVIVPAQGEATALTGVSLRAFAWADLFVGNVPVKYATDEIREKLSQDVKLVEKAPGEAALEEGHVFELFAFSALAGYTVDAALDGQRRVLIVANPHPIESAIGSGAPEPPPAPPEPPARAEDAQPAEATAPPAGQ